MEQLLENAKKIQTNLVKIRRFLHQNAETGFDLPKTLAFVEENLLKMGYTPQRCGKAGIVATLQPSSPRQRQNKAILLRADMDALPIKEATGQPFACKTGKMHACGHDMHTAMLLGAAHLLKTRQAGVTRPIKFLFQPAEEMLEGAKDVLKGGILETPEVGSAVMIHVLTDVPLPTGTIVVSAEGVGAPAADYFTITVKGKGCHGSAPQNGVDALTAAAHILIALQEISARELSPAQKAVLTVGSMETGGAGNVIPDKVTMRGTLRAFDENVRAQMKERMEKISQNVARAFRAKASLSYQGGCPTLRNDGGMSALSYQILQKTMKKNAVYLSSQLGGGETETRSGGSEDFAYISRRVPSVMLALAAGEPEKGYRFPLHHAKADFDESVLWKGSFALSAIALQKK